VMSRAKQSPSVTDIASVFFIPLNRSPLDFSYLSIAPRQMSK